MPYHRLLYKKLTFKWSIYGMVDTLLYIFVGKTILAQAILVNYYFYIVLTLILNEMNKQLEHSRK